MTEKESKMYDTILDFGIASCDAINLVRCICAGSWEEILNKIVYARTGYKTLDDFLIADADEICERWKEED